MFTTHGHHIPGTILGNERVSKVRCGGPSRCKKCALEAISTLHADLNLELENLTPHADPKNEDIVSTDKTELELLDFVRKPFYVKGVQVTEKNMEAAAKWSGGEIRDTTRSRLKKPIKCVYIDLPKATMDWQREARVGDWILQYDTGFKIYTDRAFKEAFDRVLKPSEFPVNEEWFNTADLVGHNCD